MLNRGPFLGGVEFLNDSFPLDSLGMKRKQKTTLNLMRHGVRLHQDYLVVRPLLMNYKQSVYGRFYENCLNLDRSVTVFKKNFQCNSRLEPGHGKRLNRGYELIFSEAYALYANGRPARPILWLQHTCTFRC